ncbi:MAG: hypothetical protein WCI74_03045 [Actinomycetes bacterium]
MRERSVSAHGDQRIVVEPVPRAAVLAPWWNSWLIGACSGDDLIDAMAAFGRHVVVDQSGHPEQLIVGLGQLRSASARPIADSSSCSPPTARVVLPVPGDPLGLPGPATFNQLAVQAGQAVVLDGTATALVPTASANTTVWTVHPVDPDHGTSAAIAADEATRAIKSAMLEATETLASLGPLDNRDEAGRRLRSIDDALTLLRLPASLPRERVATALSAVRVLAIVQVATASQHARATRSEQDAAAGSLLELARTARHALAAACNARQSLTQGVANSRR